MTTALEYGGSDLAQTRVLRDDEIVALPLSQLHKQLILLELERVLRGPAFRNSKRSVSLLRYVVEQTLDGAAEELKERSVGIAAFQRAPDYDTNSDHVVRSVAGEVRRRLAQHYIEAATHSDVRIELPSGSYVPQFRMTRQSVIEEPTIKLEQANNFTTHKQTTFRIARTRIAVLLAIVVLCATATIWYRIFRPGSPFDLFWAPFQSEDSSVCLGGPVGTGSTIQTIPPDWSVRQVGLSGMDKVAMADAIIMANVTAQLSAHGKGYRILNRSANASLKDLEAGPYVLIGGRNNYWTMQLLSGARYTFDEKGRDIGHGRIVDRQRPDSMEWSVDYNQPYFQFNRDYAIVARVRDPKTRQFAMIISGTNTWGMMAANDFVSRPDLLREIQGRLPTHWETKNFEVVLSVDVVLGSGGVPNILATYSW